MFGQSKGSRMSPSLHWSLHSSCVCRTRGPRGHGGVSPPLPCSPRTPCRPQPRPAWNDTCSPPCTTACCRRSVGSRGTRFLPWIPAQIHPSGTDPTLWQGEHSPSKAPAQSPPEPIAHQGPHSRPCHRRRWSRGHTAAGTGGPHRTGRPGAPGESPAPPGLGGHPGTGPSPGWKRQVTAVSPQASNTSSRCRGEQQLMNVPG